MVDEPSRPASGNDSIEPSTPPVPPVEPAVTASPSEGGAKTNASVGVQSTQVVPALSLLLGALVVLLPAATGQLVRPFELAWLLPTFVGVASLAVALLISAVLFGAFTTDCFHRVSHYLRGGGSVLGLLALVGLAVFLWANYFDNVYGAPRVLNVKSSPTPLLAGGVAEVELEVLNKSGRPLSYVWMFGGHQVSGMRTAYVRLPNLPGQYPIDVTMRWADPAASIADTVASTASGSRSLGGLRAWLTVTADKVSQSPQPIVVQCCKGVCGESKSKNVPDRKRSSTSNSKSCPCGTK